MEDTLRLSYCYLEAQMLLDPISCGRMAFGLRVTCCRHMGENQSILMGEGWGRRSGPAWWRHWHLSWVSWIRLQKWRTSPIKHIFCCCFSGAKPGPILWNPLRVEGRGLLCPPLLPGLLGFMSIESVALFNHPILCHPLLFLPSALPSMRVF